MEGDLLGLHFSVFHLDLVAAKNDGDVLAHAGQISVPVGHTLVGDSGSDVEHDNSALSLNTVMRGKMSVRARGKKCDMCCTA